MARQFNPGEHSGGDDGGYLDVAGEYIFAARTLKRDESRKGKQFFLLRFEVLTGAMKGRGFRQRIYINDEALWKVGKWCESMDQKDTFDLDCNRSSYDALCNMPFKGRVSISTKDDNGSQKKYAELDSFYTRLDDKEVDFFNRWRVGWEASSEAGDKNRPDAGRRMASASSSSGSSSAGGGFGDDPGPAGNDFGDDDIPF